MPTVDWTPPYSDHLFHDFGGATLGLGIVLAAAAIRFDRFLTIVALLAYLAYAVPHLFFHLGHLEGDRAGLVDRARGRARAERADSGSPPWWRPRKLT